MGVIGDPVNEVTRSSTEGMLWSGVGSLMMISGLLVRIVHSPLVSTVWPAERLVGLVSGLIIETACPHGVSIGRPFVISMTMNRFLIEVTHPRTS